MKTGKIVLNKNTFDVFFASSDIDAQRGFVGRSPPGPTNAMLFFVTPDTGFHMRGVEFPLDILYFNRAFEFISADTMEPQTGKSFPPEDTYYALEISAGLARKMQCTPGDKMKITTQRKLNEGYDDIVKIRARLRMNLRHDKLLDVLTEIRILPNVAVVAQEGPLYDGPENTRLVEVLISFINDSSYDLADLMRDIKKIPIIDIVKFVEYDGRPFDPNLLKKKLHKETLLRRFVKEELKRLDI